MLKFSKNFINRLWKMNLKYLSSFKNNQTNIEGLKDYMNEKDHMISGVFKDGSARFVFSDVSLSLKEAEKRFKIADGDKLKELGIAFNTCLILNSFLSGEERVKLLCQYLDQFDNDIENSLLTTIYSESIGTGEIRGFVEEAKINNNEIDLNMTSFLKISKILYNHKSEVYGIIKLTNSTKLTENDVFKFFEKSEQIKTHILFNHSHNQLRSHKEKFLSQCFILQKMPDCDLNKLEKNFFNIINNKNFQEILDNGLTASSFLQVFKDLNLQVEVRRTPIQFFCRCSKDQLIQVLIGLGAEEIKDMRVMNHRIITCKNCNTDYELTDNDFEEMLKS